MLKKFLIFLIIAIILVGAGVWGYFAWQNKYGETPPVIGGDRDSGGCLIAAGYAFNDEVGACIREFEMTPDIKQAAKLAVDYAGREYGLTVISFNSYEESGAYDIFFRSGDNEAGEDIYIRNWEAINTMGWKEIKTAIENCEVKQVFQAHSKEVSAELKNGEKLSAIEPDIDDIIDLAVSAEQKCGKIMMATE
jgi:hypothetical protein